MRDEGAPLEGEGRTIGIYLTGWDQAEVDRMAAEFGIKPLEPGAVVAVAIPGRLGLYDANAIGLEALKRMGQ